MIEPRLIVLGAVNVDLVVRGARLPQAGETVVGGVFERHHGGKGANQAVAAARALRGTPLEDRVSFLGAVGDDALGTEALSALEAERVDVTWTRTVPRTPTGVALIVVDHAGENQIAVAPGANAALEAGDVDGSVGHLAPDSVMLASLEVPLACVRRAAELCRGQGITFVLNPAPATGDATALLPLASVVVPNERELEVIAPGSAGGSLAVRHPGLAVVVTTGANGAVLLHGDGTISVDAPSVEAVDTTGAGDCLSGVLAASLLEGRGLEESVRRAVAAAAISVTATGAREGMPLRALIDSSAGAAGGRGA